VALVLSPDHKRAAVVSDWTVALWDLEAKKRISDPGAIEGCVRAFALEPNEEKRLAVGGEDRTIRVLDIASGAWSRLGTLPECVSALSWSRKGEIASGGADGFVCVRDAASGVEVKTLAEQYASFGPIMSVAFSPEGERVAFVAANRGLLGWSPKQEVAICQDLHTGPAMSIPTVEWIDAGEVACLENQRTRSRVVWTRWDPTSKESEPHGEIDVREATTFCRTRKGIATGGSSGTVRTWTRAGAFVAEGRNGEPAQPMNSVRTLVYAPKKDLLISSENDPVIRVWDATTLKLLDTFPLGGLPDIATAFALARNEERLYVGTVRGVVLELAIKGER
jgi:WD40 repeat protein